MLDIFRVLSHLILPHPSQICMIVFILRRLIFWWGFGAQKGEITCLRLHSSWLKELISDPGIVEFWIAYLFFWAMLNTAVYSLLCLCLCSTVVSPALNYMPTFLAHLSRRWMLLDIMKPTNFSQILSSFLNASPFMVLSLFFCLNYLYSYLTVSLLSVLSLWFSTLIFLGFSSNFKSAYNFHW